ncbi:uncharacterized protein LOC126655462 [Mercurialis annua]|uniref:uncharacterized protein LOC126655462 n=1 Tax=Mercurialis annua TaxID=3986 RepID=UPI00215FA078|nr:uncharacterized protein LOC126655462 [Mercurialis annua]
MIDSFCSILFPYILERYHGVVLTANSLLYSNLIAFYCKNKTIQMASFHIRSISLPSRSHPITVSLEEQLSKLNTSQSSLSLGQKLSGLKELYECLDDFLQLALTQQSLSHENSVEEALNGSLSLLDICSNTRDFFSQMRECLRELELSIRRSGNGVEAYMASRKTLNKLICKYLRNLKKQDKNSKHNSDFVVLLKSVEELSVSMFESILSFISLPKSKSKLSIFTKFMQPKNASPEEEIEANEVEKIDAELLSLKSSIDINQRKTMLKELETLEMSLKEAEEDLECVYRRLVKIRVSILNSLNH